MSSVVFPLHNDFQSASYTSCHKGSRIVLSAILKGHLVLQQLRNWRGRVHVIALYKLMCLDFWKTRTPLKVFNLSSTSEQGYIHFKTVLVEGSMHVPTASLMFS